MNHHSLGYKLSHYKVYVHVCLIGCSLVGGFLFFVFFFLWCVMSVFCAFHWKCMGVSYIFLTCFMFFFVNSTEFFGKMFWTKNKVRDMPLNFQIRYFMFRIGWFFLFFYFLRLCKIVTDAQRNKKSRSHFCIRIQCPVLVFEWKRDIDTDSERTSE